MRNSIVVVGSVRNVSHRIEREIRRLFKILKPLFEVEIFLVESDSNDSTVDILNRLHREFTDFSFVSLGNISDVYPDRIGRLIYCRNQYISRIRSNPSFRKSTYVMMIDLDQKNAILKTNSIKKSIEQTVDWAALFCNQSGRYYDILALRHPIWCPRSAWEEMAWLKKLMPNGEAKRVAIHSRMIKVPVNAELIPVISAYGGLAIYKTKYLLEHDFSRGLEDSMWDIDFVILNRKIVNSGGRLFIDPQLVNLRWNQHSLDCFRIFRWGIKWIKRARSIKEKLT